LDNQAGNDGAELRTFTGRKLDWLNALSADPKMDSKAFEVGFCIAQCINQVSHLAFLSDETIADKTHISRPGIIRARMALQKRGWVDWKRTGGANHYWILMNNVGALVDYQQTLKRERDANRERRKQASLTHALTGGLTQ